MKYVEVPDDLYETIQKLKEVFYEMDETEKKGKSPYDSFSDKDVIAILIGGFIDSMGNTMSEEDEIEEEYDNENIN